jgi:hypothetical protein
VEDISPLHFISWSFVHTVTQDVVPDPSRRHSLSRRLCTMRRVRRHLCLNHSPDAVSVVRQALTNPPSHRVHHFRRRAVRFFVFFLFTFAKENLSFCSSPRVVIFSIRATQSHNESMRLSNGLLKYMQISFAVGFLGIANDLVNTLRVYLVNPTYGSEKYDECPAWGDEKADRAEGADSGWKSSNRRLVLGIPVSRPRPHIEGAFPGQPPENTPDHPRTRFWARRFSDFTNLAFLAASVPGGVINAQFQTVIDDPDKSNRIMTIRCGVLFLFLFAT